jgi:hypothetical protein
MLQAAPCAGWQLAQAARRTAPAAKLPAAGAHNNIRQVRKAPQLPTLLMLVLGNSFLQALLRLLLHI